MCEEEINAFLDPNESDESSETESDREFIVPDSPASPSLRSARRARYAAEEEAEHPQHSQTILEFMQELHDNHESQQEEKKNSSPQTLPDTAQTPPQNAGNTTGSRSEAGLRTRNWFFTLNNYNIKDIYFFLAVWEEEKYVFQEELSTTGTQHLQGVVHYKNARSFSCMKKLHGKTHWEPAKCLADAVSYCSDPKKRTGGIWHKGFQVSLSPIDPLDGKELYWWQQEIKDIMNTVPDDRTIYWYWDPDGNTGKSTFVKHLFVTTTHVCLADGKRADAFHIIAKLRTPPRTVLFDIPRHGASFVSYTAIEKIKNGLFNSGKYDSSTVVMRCPHVFCFANFEPNYEALSQDRWIVKNISPIST